MQIAVPQNLFDVLIVIGAYRVASRPEGVYIGRPERELVPNNDAIAMEARGEAKNLTDCRVIVLGVGCGRVHHDDRHGATDPTLKAIAICSAIRNDRRARNNHTRSGLLVGV